MTNTIGHRETERALMVGHLYGIQEALSVGLVDAVVPQDQLEARVAQEMAVWLKIPGMYHHMVWLGPTHTF